MKKGIFITIEGNEGAGKTTAMNFIATFLESKGFDVLQTREPGGKNCKIAEQIRSVILDVKNTEMHGKTEAYLYAASRVQHLQQIVVPALEKNKLVLCDRFVDSSLAYQGYSRGLGIDNVYELNKMAMGDHLPDLTLLFMVKPEIGLARINKNPDRELNRLDVEKMDFHNKIYEGYKTIAKRFPERIAVIDANGDVTSVVNQVKEVLAKRLKI